MADSYVSVTWVANELVTSTKLNQAMTNDSGFHDGTALGDGIIVTRHLAAANVTAAKLDLTGTTAFTNPGTAGGTGYYINIGGLKLLVVKDCQAATGSWNTIDYTAVGFTAVPYVAGSSIKQGTSTVGGWVEFTSKATPGSNSPEQNGLSFLCRYASGNTDGKVDVIIIGK